MERLFHVLTGPDWAALSGRSHHRPASLTSLGFIHLCVEGQIEGVIERWFPGDAELLALELAPEALEAPIEWVELPHGTFPHLLGALNLSAVRGLRVLRRKEAGLGDPLADGLSDASRSTRR